MTPTKRYAKSWLSSSSSSKREREDGNEPENRQTPSSEAGGLRVCINLAIEVVEEEEEGMRIATWKYVYFFIYTHRGSSSSSWIPGASVSFKWPRDIKKKKKKALRSRRLVSCNKRPHTRNGGAREKGLRGAVPRESWPDPVAQHIDTQQQGAPNIEREREILT